MNLWKYIIMDFKPKLLRLLEMFYVHVLIYFESFDPFRSTGVSLETGTFCMYRSLDLRCTFVCVNPCFVSSQCQIRSVGSLPALWTGCSCLTYLLIWEGLFDIQLPNNVFYCFDQISKKKVTFFDNHAHKRYSIKKEIDERAKGFRKTAVLF